MLNRFSHQTTCTETGQEGERKAVLSTGPLRVQTGHARALTGLPSRYTRKSVSLTPEKRRPCGAEGALLIWAQPSPAARAPGGGPGHLSQTEPAREAPNASSRTAGSEPGGTQSPSPATPCQAARPRLSPQHTPPPPSLNSLFPGSVSWEEL